jgi:hypothetical protein
MCLRYRTPLLLGLLTSGAVLLGVARAALPDEPGPGTEVKIQSEQSRSKIDAYDFVEVTLSLNKPASGNPFTDVMVSGTFQREGDQPVPVRGFCDAADGKTFRIRFMPSRPGRFTYAVTVRASGLDREFKGTFDALAGKRRGVLRVDRDHPWHFVWEGTGEHYFWNGNTAFMLMGWRDEAVIRACIDRQQRLKVNRLRVLLGGGRSRSFWGEPIIPNAEFRSYLNPWPATRPDALNDPGFDYKRFSVAHWQKFERLLRHARERDVIISAILDWNDSPVHPAAESEDEQRYVRYAAARLSAFSNVTWDLGDDISLYRSLDWSHKTGTLLYQTDPYHHLATDHPVDNQHQDRTAEWFGFTSFQEWSRPQHDWMLHQRGAQKKTGRIIPQVNEEYGYEDHYPKWAQNYPDGASAENMRKTAWEIYMAGCYQTTGETARRGTGYWPDTGGGWVNGRGDGSMVMLQGYERIVDFFTSFAWWKTEPHDDLVNQGNFCLAEQGKQYAVYLPRGEKATVQLEPGSYRARWFNPRSGQSTPLPDVTGSSWTSPAPPDSGDWALLLWKDS